jgi:hypothetical protein
LVNPKKVPGGKKAKKGYTNSGILHLDNFIQSQAAPGTGTPAPASGGDGGRGGGAAAAGAVGAGASPYVGVPALGPEKVLQMTNGADLEIGMSWDLFPGAAAWCSLPPPPLLLIASHARRSGVYSRVCCEDLFFRPPPHPRPPPPPSPPPPPLPLQPVDLDASALCLDEMGTLIDAVCVPIIWVSAVGSVLLT